jgi:hypothetical protein
MTLCNDPPGQQHLDDARFSRRRAVHRPRADGAVAMALDAVLLEKRSHALRVGGTPSVPRRSANASGSRARGAGGRDRLAGEESRGLPEMVLRPCFWGKPCGRV